MLMLVYIRADRQYSVESMPYPFALVFTFVKAKRRHHPPNSACRKYCSRYSLMHTTSKCEEIPSSTGLLSLRTGTVKSRNEQSQSGEGV